MSGWRLWTIRIVAALAIIFVLFNAFLFFAPHALLFKLIGGGFSVTTIDSGPHRFSFEQPRFWSTHLYQDNDPNDLSVGVNGPVNDTKILYANIGVAVDASADKGGRFTTLQDLVDYQLKPRKELSTTSPELWFNIEKDTETTFLGKTAREIIILYRTIGSNLQYTPVRQKMIVFEDRGYLYTLDYEAAEDDYALYAEVGEKLFTSFNFLD